MYMRTTKLKCGVSCEDSAIAVAFRIKRGMALSKSSLYDRLHFANLSNNQKSDIFLILSQINAVPYRNYLVIHMNIKSNSRLFTPLPFGPGGIA